MAMKLAKGASSPLDAAMAALAAGSVAFLIYAMPDRQFAGLVEVSGLPRLISAAQPPLGTTARLAAVAAAALGTFLLVWAVLRALGGKKPLRKPEPETEPQRKRTIGAMEAAPAPKLRRADAHPDAPARRPIFAEHDLGEPVGAPHDPFMPFDEDGGDDLPPDEPPLAPIGRSFEPEGRRPIFEHLDLEESAAAEEDSAGPPLDVGAEAESFEAASEDQAAAFEEEPGTASDMAEAPPECDPEPVSTAPWLPPVIEQLAEAGEDAEAAEAAEAEDQAFNDLEHEQEPDAVIEAGEEPLDLVSEAAPALVMRPTEAATAEQATITQLVQRLEIALARRTRKSWPIAEPARPAAAKAPRHIDQRLRSAIDDLQQLARRG